jgi:hypothetical protein
MGYLQNYLKEEDSKDYCDGCDQLIDTEKDGDFVYDEKAEYWYCAKCTEKWTLGTLFYGSILHQIKHN